MAVSGVQARVDLLRGRVGCSAEDGQDLGRRLWCQSSRSAVVTILLFDLHRAVDRGLQNIEPSLRSRPGAKEGVELLSEPEELAGKEWG